MREKNVQTASTRTYCKRSKPLPYSNPNKQDTTALEVYPAPSHYSTTTGSTRMWLVCFFGFNGPLRQYFSLYRAVSQTVGESGEKIHESKNIQTPASTASAVGPWPTISQTRKTPRDWKCKLPHHRTTPSSVLFNVSYTV